MYREQRKLDKKFIPAKSSLECLIKSNDLEFIDKYERFLNLEFNLGVHAEDDGIYLNQSEAEAPYNITIILHLRQLLRQATELDRAIKHHVKEISIQHNERADREIISPKSYRTRNSRRKIVKGS